MFMGPLEVSKPWSSSGVEGARKYLNRVWNYFTNEENITDNVDDRLTKVYNQTVKKHLHIHHNIIKYLIIFHMLVASHISDYSQTVLFLDL